METQTPTASPYLNDLLTQWSITSDTLRQEAKFQREQIEPPMLSAHATRLTLKDRRRKSLEILGQQFQDAQARWEERLQRIEVWKNSVQHLRQQETHLHTLIGGGVWLEKAREYQDSFVRRLNRGAVRLEAAQQILHYSIEAWVNLLNERETAIADLLAKDFQPEQPFYVSRARKQPEITFIEEQTTVETALGQELLGARHLLNHLRARVRRAIQTIQARTSGAEIFYELHKHEMISELKETEAVLDKRREDILNDALAYEGGRFLLRKLNGMVHQLRCLEDIPQPKRGFLSNLLPQ